MSIMVMSGSADFVVEYTEEEDPKEIRDLTLNLFPDDDITIIDASSGEIYTDTNRGWDYWSHNGLE